MEFKFTNGKMEAVEDMFGNSFLAIIQKPTLKNLAMLAWAGMEVATVDEAKEIIEKERANGVPVTKLLESIVRGLQDGGFLGKEVNLSEPQEVVEQKSPRNQSFSKK